MAGGDAPEVVTVQLAELGVGVGDGSGGVGAAVQRGHVVKGVADAGNVEDVLAAFFGVARDFDRARTALLRLPVFTLGGVELAIRSAQNYRDLRGRGITIRRTLDCLIATFVIAQGFSLLHSDQDFAPFEQYFGLEVVRA